VFEPFDSKASVTASLANDERRVTAILHWIDAEDCTGSKDRPVPELFGMSFTSVSAAQAAADMGYSDETGALSVGLEKSFAFIDGMIGRVISRLKERRLYDSTWIIVTSAYGQAPIEQRKRRIVPETLLKVIADTVQPGLVTHLSTGDVGLIWLRDWSMTRPLVRAYAEHAARVGIQEIYSSAKIGLTLNPPESDPRMPDIILEPELGVIWGSSDDTRLASHGGMQDQDTHVALLVAGAQLTGRTDKTWVPTSQVAPLLLRALGMEKFDLQALHREHTPALPGIF
jgi:arylsulfatase A-like enzyme